MIERLSDLTAEHLGEDATDADVTDFVNYVLEHMDRNPEVSEPEAIAEMWNGGDWIGAATQRGLR